MADIKEIKTPEEYLDFAQKLAYLTDLELSQAEQSVNQGYDVSQRLPALISMVNTVGYLRGQDGMFGHLEPKLNLEDKKPLFQNEKEFENRLSVMIDKVMFSKYADDYRRALENYYVRVRTNTPPSDLKTVEPKKKGFFKRLFG